MKKRSLGYAPTLAVLTRAGAGLPDASDSHVALYDVPIETPAGLRVLRFARMRGTVDGASGAVWVYSGHVVCA